jgi:methionyl aminopeptidase
MVLAIEPMMTSGHAPVRVGGDGWAIFSQDGSPAAHFEFTVAITTDAPSILTPWHLSAHTDAAPEAAASPR